MTKFNEDGDLFDVNHPRYIAAADGAIEGLREQERLQAEKRQKAEKLQGEIRQLLAGAKSRK